MSLTDKQLSERATGIGGSDCAPACGVSSYKTQYQLYLEKRGEMPEEEAPDFLRWRALIEPIVRQEYAERTGNVVRLPTDTIRHPTIPWMLVHPDGVVDGARPRLYEGKTARSAKDRHGNVIWGEPGTDQIPDEYVLQVQHAMLVVSARFDITIEVADVAVLIGLDDYRQYEVPADAELQEMIVDEERDFWRRVQTADAPPIETPHDVRLRYGRASAAGVAQASDEVAAAVLELAALKEQGKRAEPRIEALETEIQKAFGELDTLVHHGKVLATWRAQKGRKGFDDAALGKAHPTIDLAPFRTTGDPFRRLLIKVKPGESNVSTAE